MTDKLDVLLELAIPLPIPVSFRRQAETYALQYFTQDVRERVYFNTLAVLVANEYFRMLGFETNLAKPERWNAANRLWSEANEIELSGLGCLECCVIKLEQFSIVLPQESLSGNLGYLFVEINSQNTATLLGFLPVSHIETTDSEVLLTDLLSMDDMIDYLVPQEESSFTQIVETNNLTQEFTDKKITYLRNWLNSIYEADWQPSMRDLKTVTCKKTLELAGQTFEIQLSVSQDDELILVRVIVQGASSSLPRGMQVSVPDESEIYTETVNEEADLISIPLELSKGEEFWVELRIGQSFIREYFVA
ncbi:MAG: DUF1822 family protein [Cyanomargarita calcarea GSE-NOS-MK-12-04C]|jgi:hypothetical protein|uniref:DUF1822 family protein n=1 Tax=Cyanomargarita calcarea GSE-NOS-MK-12-04C TaxID=2839659 RepID=A0A951URR6_9CYAN|nr:DUF1822 family protein [Cyanomargarita calcarea GSE-NOS-MK-12-04C]